MKLLTSHCDNFDTFVVDYIRKMANDQLADVWWTMTKTDTPAALLQIIAAELNQRGLSLREH